MFSVEMFYHSNKGNEDSREGMVRDSTQSWGQKFAQVRSPGQMGKQETAHEAGPSCDPPGQDPGGASGPHYPTLVLCLEFPVSGVEVPSISWHTAGPGLLLVDKCLRD